MTLDSNLSNAVIEGNNFDYGNFPANANIATVPTTYGYSNCIYTNADANINNNYFGASTTSGIHVYVTSNADGYGSCLISKNTFVRGTTVINAYIDVSTVTTDQIIVENFFDQYTIDNVTNENLVNLPPPPATTGPFILYERNKNQTVLKPIQKAPYLTFSSGYPAINPSERFIYSDGTSPVYVSSSATYAADFTAGVYKQQGVMMNYTTPFANNSYVRITGTMGVTNGSTSVTILGQTFSISSITNASGSLTGYIVFGNDNAYYTVTMDFSSQGYVTSITLSTPYSGNTATVSSAIFWQQGVALSYPLLFGTFSGTSGNSFITSTSNQLNYLGVGSQLLFTGTGTDNTLYTVISISANGETIGLSPNLTTSPSTATATTGLSIGIFNFSINLSEVLPENVQVISTAFGVFGNNNAGSLVSCSYAANVMTDSGGTYSTTLPGTFNVNQNSPNVTASVSQTGFISTGNGICFTSQPDFVYPVSSISGTAIVLDIPYFGTSNAATTASNFQNSLADAANYVVTGVAVGGFGSNIGFTVNNVSGNIPISVFATNSQYVKIDPPSSAFAAYTGNGRLLRYNMEAVVYVMMPGALFLPESPLIVKYRW